MSRLQPAPLQDPLYYYITPHPQRSTSGNHPPSGPEEPTLPSINYENEPSSSKKPSFLSFPLSPSAYTLSRKLFPQIFRWLTPSIHLDFTWKAIPWKLTPLIVLTIRSIPLSFILRGGGCYLQKSILSSSSRIRVAQLRSNFSSPCG